MISRAGHAGHVARRLGDIVKLPLLQRESKEQIREIWKTYHAERPDAIGRDLSGEHAQMLVERANSAPLFLFPVRRQAGHFFLLSQFQDHKHFLFTYLEEYKKNPMFAKPNLTVTLHDDLRKDKGIVLVRGDVESMVTKKESEHLIEQLIQTYLVASRFVAPTTGVLGFNKSPNTFDHESYVRAFPHQNN